MYPIPDRLKRRIPCIWISYVVLQVIGICGIWRSAIWRVPSYPKIGESLYSAITDRFDPIIRWISWYLIGYIIIVRWVSLRIEGFNTQKNLGYNLENKYSRVSWLAAKNYYQCLQIGHLINQLLELSSKFRELLKGKITIKHLWKCMIGFLIFGDIDCREISMLSQIRTQVRLE